VSSPTCALHGAGLVLRRWPSSNACATCCSWTPGAGIGTSERRMFLRADPYESAGRHDAGAGPPLCGRLRPDQGVCGRGAGGTGARHRQPGCNVSTKRPKYDERLAAAALQVLAFEVASLGWVPRDPKIPRGVRRQRPLLPSTPPFRIGHGAFRSLASQPSTAPRGKMKRRLSVFLASSPSVPFSSKLWRTLLIFVPNLLGSEDASSEKRSLTS